MRGLHVPTAGEQARLGELPTPEPTGGTVLIRVRAAGLTPVDDAVAAGFLTQMGLRHEYPVGSGCVRAGLLGAVGGGFDSVAVGDGARGHLRMVPPISAGTLA